MKISPSTVNAISQELSIERLLEMEALVADTSEEFQFLRVGPDSNVPPKFRAPVSSLCQIGEICCHPSLSFKFWLTWAKQKVFDFEVA